MLSIEGASVYQTVGAAGATSRGDTGLRFCEIAEQVSSAGDLVRQQLRNPRKRCYVVLCGGERRALPSPQDSVRDLHQLWQFLRVLLGGLDLS